MNTKHLSIFLRIGVFMIVFIIAMLRKEKKTEPKEQFDSIRLDELETLLVKLTQNKLDFNFFGIKTNPLNCIYFVHKNGKINIEYEILEEEQLHFANTLKNYAISKGNIVTELSYGNKSHYQEDQLAPVFQYFKQLTVAEAAHIGISIFTTIFECDLSDTFEVIP